MALPIAFNKSLSSTDILLAYNNNVVEFYSANLEGVTKSVKAEITLVASGLSLTARTGDVYTVTPDTGNVFYFNFKEAFINIVNQNNFSDDNDLDIILGNSNTLVIEDTDSSFASVTVTYKIFGANGSTDINKKTYLVLKGVDNIRNFTQRKLNVSAHNFFFLSPFSDISDNTVKVTWWVGYPFEIGYYSKTAGSYFVTNGANNKLVPFLTYVGKFVIDDGADNISTFFLPLTEGINPLVVGSTPNMTAEVNKKSGYCGEYFKWINMYGQWNYWLFNQRSKTERTSKTLKPLYNDFYDLDANKSPSLGIGKISNEVMTCHSSAINEDEMLVLEGLFESPKIYYFTGVQDVNSSDPDWVEVELLGQKIIIDNYKGDLFAVKCEFKFPPRNTMKL